MQSPDWGWQEKASHVQIEIPGRGSDRMDVGNHCCCSAVVEGADAVVVAAVADVVDAGVAVVAVVTVGKNWILTWHSYMATVAYNHRCGCQLLVAGYEIDYAVAAAGVGDSLGL